MIYYYLNNYHYKISIILNNVLLIQIQQYDIAIRGYEQKFKALPGDDVDAEAEMEETRLIALQEL